MIYILNQRVMINNVVKRELRARGKHLGLWFSLGVCTF